MDEDIQEIQDSQEKSSAKRKAEKKNKEEAKASSDIKNSQLYNIFKNTKNITVADLTMVYGSLFNAMRDSLNSPKLLTRFEAQFQQWLKDHKDTLGSEDMLIGLARREEELLQMASDALIKKAAQINYSDLEQLFVMNGNRIVGFKEDALN